MNGGCPQLRWDKPIDASLARLCAESVEGFGK